jgi:hypothetical protein
VTDEELMTYISESSTMSKALEEYEGLHLLLPPPPFLVLHTPSTWVALHQLLGCIQAGMLYIDGDKH